MIQSLTGSRFSENLARTMALNEEIQEYVSYLDFMRVSSAWPNEVVSHADVSKQASAVLADLTFLMSQSELPEA